MRTVIIPTLNEEVNITSLIPLIFDYLGNEQVHIIIVDDNSKDKTHEIVNQLMGEYKNLSLIIRIHEKGLGSAVRKGASLVQSGSVVVMDADFSHHPRYLPRIFEKLESGYDVVVGSRYIKGGKIVGWTSSRIAISKIATSLSTIIFHIQTTDPMSGFVGCKSSSLLLNGFRSNGFKFLLELLVRNRTLKVADIPIIFNDRIHGSSKLGSQTILEFLALIMKLLISQEESKQKLVLEGS